jgi:hypothetical protein
MTTEYINEMHNDQIKLLNICISSNCMIFQVLIHSLGMSTKQGLLRWDVRWVKEKFVHEAWGIKSKQWLNWQYSVKILFKEKN